jgi:hypothetical protein
MSRLISLVIANNYFILQSNVFHSPFFSEGVTKTELLAIRFGTPENAALFKVCLLKLLLQFS